MTKRDIIVAPCGIQYRKIQDKEYHLHGRDYKFKWVLLNDFSYYSPRYDKYVELKAGMLSDGATGAFDIPSCSWWIHDQLCNEGAWSDGTLLTNWQCSNVIADVLREEGRWWRDGWWKYATFFGGGGKAKENGMIFLKHQERDLFAS